MAKHGLVQSLKGFKQHWNLAVNLFSILLVLFVQVSQPQQQNCSIQDLPIDPTDV